LRSLSAAFSMIMIITGVDRTGGSLVPLKVSVRRSAP
jgi:hypothetical protein